MADREKVINGLECCDFYFHERQCKKCPYSPHYQDCRDLLIQDAKEILKAQQPRVMALEEVRLLNKDAVVWYERKGAFGQPRPRVVEFVYDTYITFTDGGILSFSVDGYGECWRLWTSRPDEKVRAETLWE